MSEDRRDFDQAGDSTTPAIELNGLNGERTSASASKRWWDPGPLEYDRFYEGFQNVCNQGFHEILRRNPF
jgi:hypothetical protein